MEPVPISDDHAVGDEILRTRRKLIARFLFVLVFAVIIYLTTDLPIVSALLPALFAGKNSFQTCIWILTVDQNTPRKYVCAAFSMATAFWQGAAGAVAAIVAFVVVVHLTGNAPDIEEFASTMLTLVGGISLTTILGLAASLGAAVAGVRVWIHPRLNRLVRGDLQSVAKLSPTLFLNHAIFVLATSIALPVVILCGIMLVDFKSILFSLAVVIIGPTLALAAYCVAAARVVAGHPADCWS